MSKLTPVFKDTITVLNRLNGVDNKDKIDKWYKSVIKDCFFSNKEVSSGVKGLVTAGTRYICRISESKSYTPYDEWIKTQRGFTFSLGDYIILGEVKEADINTKNIVQIINKYKPNSFEIKYFKDNTRVGFLKHYHLEGV